VECPFNSLPNVLIAWRLNQVAYAGDIRKMFNQILIHPEDQVFHRFLWRANEEEEPKVYQWIRLNFGDKPALDIATGAINTLVRAAQAEYPEASH
jgi:alpha-glucuronidase